jgi:hypothetical protein
MAQKKVVPFGNEPVIIDDAGDRARKRDLLPGTKLFFRARQKKKNLPLGKPEPLPLSSFVDIEISAVVANVVISLFKKKAASIINISSGAPKSPLSCSAGIFGVITPGGPMPETSPDTYTLDGGGPIIKVEVDDSEVSRPVGADRMVIQFTIK